MAIRRVLELVSTLIKLGLKKIRYLGMLTIFEYIDPAKYLTDALEAKKGEKSLSFNIKKKDLPKIKEYIREFSDQMVQNYEAKSGEGEETYHLNVQFFSLTK